ncbi:hypothetical protein C5O27_00175 [Gordonia alkanivorans]|uniref:hypothetical protein n=1 Tax=Gordonia alkanivorans TaxID=84096 RepID=UPI000FDE8CB1|nr:hypothetical protein [Gordonia alkanivorans]AZZ79711.1 hypothetical protein C5O27_00175 [Gordonia alkanivorans]
MAKKKQGDDTAVVMGGLAVMGLIWFVVKFWYVLVAIGAFALLVFIASKLISVHSARTARLRAERQALLARCEEQNRAYSADPVAYLAQLEGGVRELRDEAPDAA